MDEMKLQKVLEIMEERFGHDSLIALATVDDTKTKIISAAIKAVRQYGLEGVRIQNISVLAGCLPGCCTVISTARSS